MDWLKEEDAAPREAAPPPNPPLTLEELREMVGGPSVWVVTIGEDEENYALITGVDDTNVYMLSTLRPNDYGSIELYGDSWIAYRRKPETTAVILSRGRYFRLWPGREEEKGI